MKGEMSTLQPLELWTSFKANRNVAGLDTCLRRATLYPAELRVQRGSFSRLARHRQWRQRPTIETACPPRRLAAKRRPILILAGRHRPVDPWNYSGQAANGGRIPSCFGEECSLRRGWYC
jgi:hypothetical protein